MFSLFIKYSNLIIINLNVFKSVKYHSNNNYLKIYALPDSNPPSSPSIGAPTKV
jgi:hypothetical protein